MHEKVKTGVENNFAFSFLKKKLRPLGFPDFFNKFEY